MHVDEFIDGSSEDAHEPSVKYARWFLHLHRLSAGLFYDFEQWINPYQLYCTYKGKQYRVTGASSMGDVWLVEDFSKDSSYDYRVNVKDCSEWKDKPDVEQNEQKDNSALLAAEEKRNRRAERNFRLKDLK